MVNNTNFNINNVNKYIDAKNKYIKSQIYIYQPTTFQTNAILSLFDKNIDGVISRAEFEQVSKETFEKFKKQLKEYVEKQGEEPQEYSYEKMTKYVSDNVITSYELDDKVYQYDLKDKGIKENKNHKEPYQMPMSEIIEELRELGYPEDDLDLFKDTKFVLRNEYRIALEQVSTFDENSDIVDWHIGTFHQGINGLCSLLAFTDNMATEELKKIYTKKTDENGDIYYEVQFPQDAGTNFFVKVTEKEINSGELRCKNKDGKEQILSDLPSGDMDATLLSMAYIKRFGDKIFFKGIYSADEFAKVFTYPGEKGYKASKDLKPADLKQISEKTFFSILDNSDMKEKKLAYEQFDLPDGRHCKINKLGIELSDGLSIPNRHAYSYRGFDDKKKEFILSCGHAGNTSVFRVPYSLLKYFTALLPNK